VLATIAMAPFHKNHGTIFFKSLKGPLQKKFMTRHYVEQVWLYMIIFLKIDLCDVLPPIEDLPMEENDYVTHLGFHLLSCFEEFSYVLVCAPKTNTRCKLFKTWNEVKT
jgi:hypothetical protein